MPEKSHLDKKFNDVDTFIKIYQSNTVIERLYIVLSNDIKFAHYVTTIYHKYLTLVTPYKDEI